MAKVQNTLIGRASGSVGGATFTTWKGINVLKSKPESVANPKTLGQRSQRSRMSVMVAIYRLLASIITVGFKTRAIGKSAYNAFVSQNIVNATTVDNTGGAFINYPELKFSLGTIGAIPIASIVVNPSSTVATVAWDNSLAPVGSNPDDIAFGVLYNANTKKWVQSVNSTRAVGSITFQLDTQIIDGDDFHCYLAFKSADDADTSDSVYQSQTAY